VQDAAAVVGYDLNMPVEEHPVAGLRVVSIAQRMPAVVVLSVLEDRQHVR
jgi:hypothetical protein